MEAPRPHRRQPGRSALAQGSARAAAGQGRGRDDLTASPPKMRNSNDLNEKCRLGVHQHSGRARGTADTGRTLSVAAHLQPTYKWGS